MTIDVKDSSGQSSTSIQEISNGMSEPAIDDDHGVLAPVGDDGRNSLIHLVDSTISIKTRDIGDRFDPVIVISDIDGVGVIDDKKHHNDDDDGDGDDDDNDDEDQSHGEFDPGHPVDTGWAWCVMLSCFVMHTLVVGGAKSFGVFVPEFQERFGVGARELGLINGMALMLMLSQGIFVNMLADRFSGRRVILVGSVIILTGFVMSAFIPSFHWLYVSYGLVTGVGFALSFSPSIVMVGQSFKKYRSFAFGIALSGSGFGSFTIPNLVRILLKEYSLQGCLIILGAIMLNVALSGMLLPPLNRFRRKHDIDDNIPNKDDDDKDVTKARLLQNEDDKEAKDKGKRDTTFIASDADVGSNCYSKEAEEEEVTINNCDSGDDAEKEIRGEVSDRLVYTNKTVNKVIINIEESRLVSLSTGDISHKTRNDRAKEDNSNVIYKQNRNLSKSVHVLHPEGESDRHLFVGDGLKHRKHQTPSTEVGGNRHLHESTASLFKNITHKALLMFQDSNPQRPSTFAYASNCDIAMASQGALWNSVHSVNKNNAKFVITSVNSIASDGGQGHGKPPCCRRGDSPLFDWSLLRKPMFLLHLFSVFLGYACYINVLFMLPDFAFASGQSQDMSAMCLSVVGILELIGRITFPPLTDILCVQRRTSWITAIGAMGLFNVIITQIPLSLESLLVYACLFGYACGCFTSLIPILCTEANGPEKLGSSLGLTTLCMSLSVMAGPPICGTIKDKTGKWDFAFIAIGCLALLGATLNFVVICVRRHIRSDR